MTVDCEQQNLDYQNLPPLLRLPPEIRAVILDFSLDFDTCHVLQDTVTVCARSSDKKFCRSVEQCHDRCASPGQGCENCPRGWPPGVVATCRSLRNDARAILYEKVLMTFPNPQTMLKFYNAHAQRLGRRVYLDCGPAKHGDAREKKLVLTALHTLATLNTPLRELHLCFGSYYGIHHDDYILNRGYIKAIGRFRRVHRLTLQLGPPPLGPLAMEELRHNVETLKKMAQVEDIFSKHIGAAAASHGAGINFVQIFKAAVRREWEFGKEAESKA